MERERLVLLQLVDEASREANGAPTSASQARIHGFTAQVNDPVLRRMVTHAQVGDTEVLDRVGYVRNPFDYWTASSHQDVT